MERRRLKDQVDALSSDEEEEQALGSGPSQSHRMQLNTLPPSSVDLPPGHTKPGVHHYTQPGLSAPSTSFSSFIPPAEPAPPNYSLAPSVSSVTPFFKRPGPEASSNPEVSPLKRSKATDHSQRQEPTSEPGSKVGSQRSSLLLTLARRQLEGVTQSLAPELEARERREEEMMETVQRIARDGQEYR